MQKLLCAVGLHEYSRWVCGAVVQVRTCQHCGFADTRRFFAPVPPGPIQAAEPGGKRPPPPPFRR